ncbi:MAG: ThuA domain-containing protein [Verrucomicrobiota bacterium]
MQNTVNSGRTEQPTPREGLGNKYSTLSRSFLILLTLASGMAAAAEEEPKIPGIMLPELTKVTPEMVTKMTAACPNEPLAKPEKPRKILVFGRCENFTHHSISVAEKALTILGEKTKAWSTDISYDYSVFEAAKLAAYDAIVLNNCQNMVFPEGAPREDLLNFVRNGKGIVALHSAVDNFGSDDFNDLRNMIGGCSAGHPWGHYLAWRFKIEEPKHSITAHLNPDGFSMKDAIFQFDTRTGRKNVRVLVSMDMSDPTTAKDENGKPRGFRTDGLNPVVWVRHEGKGRVFVNCFGNNDEIFWSASMLKLNLAGIQYAIGDLKADDTLRADGGGGSTIGGLAPAKEATATGTIRTPEGTVVQVDVGALLIPSRPDLRWFAHLTPWFIPGGPHIGIGVNNDTSKQMVYLALKINQS